MRSGQTPLPYCGRNRGLATENKENHTRDGVEKKIKNKRKKTTTMSKILEEYGKEMYQEGFEEGLQEAAIKIANKLMAHGKDVPFIAKTLKVEEDVVEEWLKEDEHSRV